MVTPLTPVTTDSFAAPDEDRINPPDPAPPGPLASSGCVGTGGPGLYNEIFWFPPSPPSAIKFIPPPPPTRAAAFSIYIEPPAPPPPAPSIPLRIFPESPAKFNGFVLIPASPFY